MKNNSDLFFSEWTHKLQYLSQQFSSHCSSRIFLCCRRCRRYFLQQNITFSCAFFIITAKVSSTVSQSWSLSPFSSSGTLPGGKIIVSNTIFHNILIFILTVTYQMCRTLNVYLSENMRFMHHQIFMHHPSHTPPITTFHFTF